MKTFLALILCGVSYAVASTTCENYENSCIKTGHQEKLYPESDAEFESYCKNILEELDCYIEHIFKCPRTLTSAFHESIRENRRVFGRFCDKNDPISEKYREKASCLNKEETHAEDSCRESATEEEYCKRTYEAFKCAEDKIKKACGEDSQEVVSELFKPKYKINVVFCDF